MKQSYTLFAYGVARREEIIACTGSRNPDLTDPLTSPIWAAESELTLIRPVKQIIDALIFVYKPINNDIAPGLSLTLSYTTVKGLCADASIRSEINASAQNVWSSC